MNWTMITPRSLYLMTQQASRIEDGRHAGERVTRELGYQSKQPGPARTTTTDRPMPYRRAA